jgi:mono/diheme cytochrome c family protein
MLRKTLKVFAVLGSLGLLAALVLVARAKWLLERDYAFVAQPPIAADHSPAGVARGELLFQSLCMECHGGRDGRATGKHLDEVPAFLGRFWSANLAHPEHGVHRRNDGQLARVLRNGVLPDGRLSLVMNGFGKLGDADVAALLGYMRSGASVFAPGGQAQPRSQLSLIGTLIAAYVAKVSADAPASGVHVPAKSATVAYGRYMAQAMDCVGCHTDGFSTYKLHEPGAFAGGFELSDPAGLPIFTRNITFDEGTGIGRWSLDDFQRAVTGGVRPDGYLVRKPMPTFARLDRSDIAAIYAFLREMPKVQRANKSGGSAPRRAHVDDAPEQLFSSLGCAGCHGEARPYRDQIRAALGKSDDDVASWILEPQALKPGTAMPSFAGAIDRAQARKLAAYVKELARKRGG